jgi:ribosomal protein S18 acetylase RimI-like enzyme
MDTVPVYLPYLPADDQLLFRRPDSQRDASALAAIQAGRAVHDAVDPLSVVAHQGRPTAEDMLAALVQAEAEQALDRWLLAEFKGQVVAYSSIESWYEADDRWVYLTRVWVLPDWRGQTIDTALLRWGEHAASRLAQVEHPGESFELAGVASSTEPELAALLLQEGYTPGPTELEMELDPAAPVQECPLPTGIEVRAALPEHILPIAESIAEAYRGEFPGNRFRKTHSEVAGQAEWYSQPIHDRALWQVAWHAQQVVGQVLPLILPGSGGVDRALIDEASVRPAWRRQGLARALLTRAILDLRSRDLTVIRLATGAEFRTRARDLYASLGFHVVKAFPSYRKTIR